MSRCVILPIPGIPGAIQLRILYDDSIEYMNIPLEQGVGPAAGLLSAYKHDPQATWLVLACDFPLMTVNALKRLQDCYEHLVTCYKNELGYSEPLLAIWSPTALRALEGNVLRRRFGPSSVIQNLEGKLLVASSRDNNFLFNTDTPEEWAEALEAVPDSLGDFYARPGE